MVVGGNSSFVDLTAKVPADGLGNTTACAFLLYHTPLDLQTFVGFFKAGHLSSRTLDYILVPADDTGLGPGCYLFIGGGRRGDIDHLAEDEYYLLGNWDLIRLVSGTLIDFAAVGSTEHVAACGILPDCLVQNTFGTRLEKTPELHWCVGGSSLPMYWNMYLAGTLGS